MMIFTVTKLGDEYTVCHDFTDKEKEALRKGNPHFMDRCPMTWAKKTKDASQIGALIKQCEKGIMDTQSTSEESSVAGQ